MILAKNIVLVKINKKYVNIKIYLEKNLKVLYF